ncbi:MAG: T9SS type A sorting domain-containing protein, partial [Bacteroidales bacterium]|nr:T9SS type A sorting domain-containing protein [Bacteroidales bacterium]
SAWASVELLKIADDKCQSLFESCFKVIEGPDAPDLVFQEMDQSLIIYITNTQGSNNYTEEPEDYMEEDHSIPAFHINTTFEDDTLEVTIPVITQDTLGVKDTTYKDTTIYRSKQVNDTVFFDRNYRFEGYQIYQLANESVTAEDLSDASKAILVFQCDKKNKVGKILNYEFNATVGADVATEKVNGSDKGIRHTFTITEDAFSTSNIRTLVNYKKYYFMAIAYAYNNYVTYSVDEDQPCLYGQKKPYLAGNKNIKVYTAIPHKTAMEENGTIARAVYGTQPAITRLEGQGNGGNIVDLTEETIEKIMAGSPWKADTLNYKEDAGPISVKVVDPLQLSAHDYTVQFFNVDGSTNISDSTYWRIIYENEEDGTFDTIVSQTSINVDNEQILTDKQGNMMGLSVTIYNNRCKLLDEEVLKVGVPLNEKIYSSVEFLSASITYSDSTMAWLGGVADVDGSTPLNWIRSGSTKDNDYFMRDADGYSWDQTNARKEDAHYPLAKDAVIMKEESAKSFYCFYDSKEYFEKMIGGTWAPYPLASVYDDGPQFGYDAIEDPSYTSATAYIPTMAEKSYFVSMAQLYSVNVVLTPDKSKWTRCPVVEINGDKALTIGQATRHFLRKSYSVDKAGIPYNDPACNKAEACMWGDDSVGMSWFPGYAINVETGERLNMMFGEDSWLLKYNGGDMIFNPTFHTSSNAGYVMGGKHYIYVFGHQDLYYDNGSGKVGTLPAANIAPLYDEGKWAFQSLKQAESYTNAAQRDMYKARLYMNIMWTAIPLARDTANWLKCDATIRLRVSRPYQRLSSNLASVDAGVKNPVNNNMPLYQFSTKEISTITNAKETAVSAMDLINVVPNPYFARSSYETDQLDTRVKFINLPKNCTIKIYTINGILVRTFKKDNTDTYVDWDLKNAANIPVAAGVYLIHIQDNVTGEIKTLKWYGIQRPTDVNAF